jgi:hypothetical protein
MNTPQDRSYSLAAAQGITPRMVNSWYAFLPRNPRVLVPIHLEVLMVRKTGGQWARCAMTPPAQDPGGVIEGASMMPAPFQDLPLARPRGAYLHWAVPDALTAGFHDEGKTTFPAIPDRWLVMRIGPSAIPYRRTVAGWVLQAGDAVPTVTPMDSWKETGAAPSAAKKPLTALGHGDAAWAAYFDNVVNRLGFYDDLSGVPVGPIGYLVCGWYSDPSLDPLGDTGIRSLTDFDAKMQELQWSLPDKEFHEAAIKATRYIVAAGNAGLATKPSARMQQRYTAAFEYRPFGKQEPGSTPDGPPYTTDGNWWPEDSLYHGAVLGIGWPDIGWPGNEKGTLSGEEAGPPSADKVNVAFGETLGEALAVLVSKANGSNKEARILEAFQQGMLPELDEPDGRARLDAALHAAAFGSIPGGSTVERVWQPPTGPPPVTPASPNSPDPGVFQRFQSGQEKILGKDGKGAMQQPAQQQMQMGLAEAQVFQAKSYLQETDVMVGTMGDVLMYVSPTLPEPYVPGKWTDASRALPRLFHPTDPAILVQGVNRSFKHGYDGRFSPDGTLQCRLSGTCLHEFAALHGDIVEPAIFPEDILDRGVENGSVPPECEELLGEAAILDPGACVVITDASTKGLVQTPDQRNVRIQNVLVQQTAVYSMRDPRVDPGPFISKSHYSGTMPSPVAIGLPYNPWSPVHLEWRVEFTPSPGGVNDWNLGENDYNEAIPTLPPKAGAPGVRTFEGRSPLTDGANLTAARAVRKALDNIKISGGTGSLSPKMTEQFTSDLSQMLLLIVGDLQVASGNVPDGDRSLLEDIATALEHMDVLSAGIDGLHLALRAGYAPDGVSAPAPGTPAPTPFYALRAGFLRVLRLRMVDCFGQYIELAGSGPNSTADPARVWRSEPLDVSTRPELLALPPRFTAPARVRLRFTDSAGGPNEAGLATDVSPAISPVCGYLMPQHLDRALEFFGADGGNLGVLRPADDGSILWEDAPGRPSTVGQSPSRAISNPFLGAIGEGLLKWGVADAGLLPGKDTALEGLLRVIDSTLWSVDPFGHTGDEHLSLLVGHPVAVMRAVLSLEVKEPVDPAGANQIKVPLRLGSLAHWQDGLLGYYVNDDFTRLYCSDAAAAGLARAIGPGEGFLQQVNLVPGYYNTFGSDQAADPVSHPFIDTSGTIWVYPNQDVVLTLLVEPLAKVHATTGLVPRKDVGMRREWVTGGLSKIAPTFRFGPVLIDPQRVRMPIAAELNGTWSWDHRTDVTTWADLPVTHATQDATLADDPPVGSEGWLRLNPPEEGAQK